jgi:hypothetical protein
MMWFFVSLFLMCRAAEEDGMSLLQTHVGVNESVEDALQSRIGVNEGVESDQDVDRVLAGKGTPPRRRRRSRRRRSRRRTPAPTPPPTPSPTPVPPTPSPTPVCNGLSINQFKGDVLTVSQTSSYYGQNTYTYMITIGGDIKQQTSDAGEYFLGTHTQFGDMIEYFRNGENCGSTPRQADVYYTVGPSMELVSAQETSMCVYKFNVQLPESKCNLPLTPLDDLDSNNEDGDDETSEELADEANAIQECKKWCSSKKHKDKCWSPGDCPAGVADVEPYKCKWSACGACSECD